MPGFLIDLDGTLYNGKQPIHAAFAFIDFLRQHQLPFLLLTNNSSRTPEEIARHLYSISSIVVQPTEIFTSAQATARFVVEQQQNGLVYCIGEEGLEMALTAAGLEVFSNQYETDLYVSEQIHHYGSPKFVVQGIDRHFTYAKLKLALQFITAGASYISTNPDRVLPSDGGIVPGAGAIAASIEAASLVKPVIIGKPSPIIMNYAIELIGLSANDIWVVGDNLNTDIRGGKAAGCQTVLVLTGLATAENVQQQMTDSGIQPDIICADLLEFIVHIQRQTDLLY